jgi:hypothetical protein
VQLERQLAAVHGNPFPSQVSGDAEQRDDEQDE